MSEEDKLLLETSLDRELDDFFSGAITGAPKPAPVGRPQDPVVPPFNQPKPKVSTDPPRGVASASASASPQTSGRFQTAKEQVGRVVQSMHPWRDFLCPVSCPGGGGDAFSRVTSNLYLYQTNYTILFVLKLLFSILLQPSSLMLIAATVVAWVLFLRKNDDSDWRPKILGTELGRTQRWLALSAATAVALVIAAGSAISNAVALYIFVVLIHAVLHDTSAKGPDFGSPGSDPVPL
eukprot:TRINITY_DN42266_c0_g1_i1.p1 TRINITY_DN42266_c0_g1~~TRINITY_DN42266_c0_g1_i1.p1  ORF type:complete len:274 (+),score=30.93 TRINITY_DN42266_c0_g1_i1:117-824(+)